MRRTGRITAVAVLILGILLIGLVAAINTPRGQAYITAQILNLVTIPGQKVAIGRSGGQWPSHIELQGVTFSDSEGVWLTIDKLFLDWRPLALLRREVDIDRLHANTATIARFPVSPTRTSAPAPFDLEGLIGDLSNVRLASLTIDTIALADAVFGAPMRLNAAGSSTTAAGALVTRLQIQRSDAPGTAQMQLSADRQASALTLNADMAGVAVDGTINVARPGETLSGSLRLTREAAQASGSVDAVFSGTRAAPVVALAFDLNTLTTGGRPIEKISGNLTAQRRPAGDYGLIGNGVVSDIRALAPELAAITAAEGQWTLSMAQRERVTTLETLQVRAGDVTLDVNAVMENDTVRPASITFTAKGLGRAVGFADDASLTSVKLSADTFSRGGEGQGSVNFGVSGLAANAPQGFPNALAGSAEWTLDTQRLHVTKVAGLAPGVRLAGESTWPRVGNGLDHAATAITLDVDPRDKTSPATPLQISIKLDGILETLRAAVRTSAAQLGAGEDAVSDFNAVLTATRQGETFTADFNARGLWRGSATTLAAKAEKGSDDEIRITGIQADGIGGRMAGDFLIDARSGLVDGAVDVKIADITALASALGADVSGALTARVTLMPANNQQRASVDLNLRRLSSNPLTAHRLTVKASVDDAWKEQVFDVRLDTSAGTLVGRPLAALAAGASGKRADFNATLTARGAQADPWELTIGARIAGNDDVAVTFNRLLAQDGAFNATLTAPAVISISEGRIEAPSVRLRIGDGTVDANVAVNRTDGTVGGGLSARNVSLTPFAPTGFESLNGVLDGEFSVGGSMTDATLTGAAEARFAADRRYATPAFSVKLNVQGGDGRLALNVVATGFSDQPATASATLPVRLDLTQPRAVVDADGAIQGAINWNGNIAPLWRVLPVDQHLLSGDVRIDMTVAGTVASPNVRGEFHLVSGGYENIPGGTVLRDLNLDISTRAGDDFEVALSAYDTGNGTVKASGHITRDGAGKWHADVSGNLNQLHALARDDVTGNVSGAISYKGPLFGGVLKGELQMTRATINLDATGVPEVPLLRSYQASKADHAAATTPTAAAPLPITFDVTLTMLEPLRVEGQGLESAWRGQLYIGGNMIQPDIHGVVTVERGTFTFIGQSFELESGSVTFTGGGRINPQLNVVAVRQVSDITVTVNITGRATAPNIALSSRPSLPQDEVLARLLFNRAAGELGPLESLQLASAAADMTGLSRGGISGMVRRTFGLDTFSLGGTSGDAVVVGRQLSRNLFVSVEQSINSTNRLIVISWRLSSHFSLRSSASDQTGADFGVFWRKDY
jgi:translocation and assembly module TamB